LLVIPVESSRTRVQLCVEDVFSVPPSAIPTMYTDVFAAIVAGAVYFTVQTV